MEFMMMSILRKEQIFLLHYYYYYYYSVLADLAQLVAFCSRCIILRKPSLASHHCTGNKIPEQVTCAVCQADN